MSPWWYEPWPTVAYPYYAPPPADYNYPPPYGPGDDPGTMNQSQAPDQNQAPSVPSSGSQAEPQPDLNEDSNPSANSISNASSDANQVYAESDPNPDTANVAESRPTVLLYLKDGTTFPATDYWLADGKLHFRVSYGGTSTIEMDDLDLQRTINENAKRGVRFTLAPQPALSMPAPSKAESTSTSAAAA